MSASDFDLAALETGFERAFAEAVGAGPGAVVLCRHSIRGPIPVDPARRDVPLLVAGRELCQRLGSRLGWPFRHAQSSPMLRCTDSLDAYRRGACVEPRLELDTRLGAPGAFIEDVDAAWESYVRFRKHELVRRLHDAPETVAGYRSLQRGAAKLLHALAHGDDDPHIACSHDILMSALLSWAFERAWPRPDWPNFFEGIALRFDATGEAVRVSYRGESVTRVVPSLQAE